ncbi:MAG: SdpI family protein [Clostridia bacterium]|nr:SdpI family protein [Clostridia bacterium]
MIKTYKWTILLTSVIILLPMLIGLFGGSFLPAEIVEYWGLDHTDGWAFASIFLILPPVMLAIHWFCILFTSIIDKNNPNGKRIFKLMLWTVPAITLASCGIFLAIAFTETVNIFALCSLAFGIGMLLLGNYMPKITRNRTMGIKTRLTLANDDNWYATHRVAGKAFFIGGLVMLVNMLLPMQVQYLVALVVLLVCVALPMVYSHRFYKKQLAQGKATKEDYKRGLGELNQNNRSAVVATIVVVASLIVIMPLILFTGDVEITTDDTALHVDVSGWSDCALAYADIDSAEYREHAVDGQRISGVGSARLLLGAFRNEEFGNYTRYTYTGDKPCIVLMLDERIYVIGTNDAAQTKALYDLIAEKIGE